MNFFKPGKNTSPTFEPMPIPIKSTKQIIYDPDTGEKISDNDLKFDPDTGERINPITEAGTRFDIYDEWDNKKVISEAKLIANDVHNKHIHYGCGAGSCIASPFWGISLLGSLIYANSNIFTNFNEKETVYENLTKENKYLFKSEYKREERSLRRRDISNAQKSCGCGKSFS